MDLILSDFNNHFARTPFDTLWPTYMDRNSNLLRTDMLETDSEYKLVVDVPGFSKEDVKITVNNDVLHITTENKWDSDKNENWRYVWRERRFQLAEKKISLPQGTCDKDNIDANYENGVLTVVIPKIKPANAKKVIDIK